MPSNLATGMSALRLTCMILSLSVRIAEEFQSKEKASMRLEELTDLARSAGYKALCMRASQVGVHSPPDTVARANEVLSAHQLSVSMVTGDFAIVYNNDVGPACLRDPAPYLELAVKLEAPLLRVALKREEDIPWAQRAADAAAERGLKLAHQCHTRSLFETVDGIERTLRQIGRTNFGLIYEPANLELCGQEYGAKTIQRLAFWVFNVYLQNQIIKPDGKLRLDTWCRGPISFDLIQIHQTGGIKFDRVFEGLAAIRYDGPVTVHQSGVEGERPADSAKQTAIFLTENLRRFGFTL